MPIEKVANSLRSYLTVVARMAEHRGRNNTAFGAQLRVTCITGLSRDMRQNFGFGIAQFLILLICAGTAVAGTQQELLPDGSLRPGTRITIRAGQQREILFRREGVRFLSGRARIDVAGPLVDEHGQEKREIRINADDRSRGIPWMHDEKPFRLRIHAETDFTLEARKSWEWSPEDDHQRL